MLPDRTRLMHEGAGAEAARKKAHAPDTPGTHGRADDAAVFREKGDYPITYATVTVAVTVISPGSMGVGDAPEAMSFRA